MTDWADAIQRGVDALDFRPLGLNVKQGRPPEDADGLDAMFAAISVHNHLRTMAWQGLPGAQAAWSAHEHYVTLETTYPPPGELARLLVKYRQTLMAAVLAFVAGDEKAKIKELVDRYKLDLKRVDD